MNDYNFEFDSNQILDINDIKKITLIILIISFFVFETNDSTLRL